MKVELLTHSSIRVIDSKGRTIYLDPFNVANEVHDADVIFITHDHFDHFSLEDINKIYKSDTIFVMPHSLRNQIKSNLVRYVEPYDKELINDLDVEARPACNINKHYHPKANEWVGYVVRIDNESNICRNVTKKRMEIIKSSFQFLS